MTDRAIVDAATELRAAGYAICRIAQDEKRPTDPNWQLHTEEPASYQAGHWQLGIVHGWNGSLCVDVDNIAFELAQRYLPPTGMIDYRPNSGASSHWHYLLQGDVSDDELPGPGTVIGDAIRRGAVPRMPGTKRFQPREGGCGVELRGGGSQTVVPPSLHPSGVRRAWVGGARGAPAAIGYRQLREACEAFAREIGWEPPAPPPVGTHQGSMAPPSWWAPNQKAKDEALEVLRRHGPAISGQGGHDHTWAACHRALDYLDIDSAWELLQWWNSQCQPPWTPQELRRKLDQAAANRTAPIGHRSLIASIAEAVPKTKGRTVSPEKILRPKGGREPTMPDISASVEMFRSLHPPHLLQKLSPKESGRWMYFNGRYWEDLDPAIIRRDVVRCVGPEATKDRVATVLMHLEDVVYAHRGAWPDPVECTVFKNGTLYYDDEVEWCENHFDCGDFATTYIPHNYIPNADCPKFKAFVQKVQPDPQIQAVLQEWMGYTLTPGNLLNAWLLLFGRGGNGKSTFMNIMSMMLGERNVGTVNLQDIGDRFALGARTECLLLYDDDVSNSKLGNQQNSTSDVGDMIKKITGNSHVEVSAKRVQPWAARIKGKLMANCNKKPHWAVKHDEGSWRRLQIMPWEADLQSERILGYERLLTDELEGIISWAVEGAFRIFSKNPETGRHNGFSYSEKMETLKIEFRGESDTVLYFIETYMEPSNDKVSWKTLKPLFELFMDVSQEELGSRYMMNISSFAERLASHGIETKRPSGWLPENRPVDYDRVVSPNSKYPWSYRGWACMHPEMPAQVAVGQPINTNVVQGPRSPSYAPVPGQRV